MAIKLSNVIGAPFEEFVLQQLYTRARQNSVVNRSNEEVLFLANKTAWARLISSVNISVPSTDTVLAGIGNQVKSLVAFYQKLGLNPTDYPKPESLAQDWVLEAGTSKQSGNGIILRQGIGPDGAYGLGGTEELGYRPMPGLTSIQVETTGRLGSLRQATINFKVWNMNQLNVIEALYFRLGYSMLLEWGHTQYYNSPPNGESFQTQDIYGIGDPFIDKLRKEDIQQAIGRKVRKTSGNYDGMLGVVSNFNWSFNQEGGYDCTVRLIGLGSVMDSLRINQSYTLPEGALKEFKKNQSTIQALIQQAAELAAKRAIEEYERRNPPPAQAVEPLPKNKPELRQREEKYDDFSPTATDGEFNGRYGTKKAVQIIRDIGLYKENYYDYYASFNGKKEPQLLVEKAQQEYGGLWLDQRPRGFQLIKPGDNVFLSIDVLAEFSTVVGIVRTGPNTTQDIANFSFVDSSNSAFVQLFDYTTGQYTIPNPGGGAPRVITLGPDDFLRTTDSETTSFSFSRNVTVASGTKQSFYFGARWAIGSGADRDFVPTRRQFTQALEKFYTDGFFTGLPVTITSINYDVAELLVTIVGTFTVNMKVFYNYNANPNPNEAGLLATGVVFKEEGTGKLYKIIPITVTFQTNNSGFIYNKANPTPPETPPGNAKSSADSGDAGGQASSADTDQIESAGGFQSALHAMLVVVKTEVQAKSNRSTRVTEYSIKSITERFYQDGALNGVFSPSVNTFDPNVFNLTAYALKGYNSSLMLDPALYDSIPTVSFDDLCYGYIVRYPQGGIEDAASMIQAPVYIKLGYLLAFLNNMCLIYDSTQQSSPGNVPTGAEKRPYVYIDFNPDTNFCLTSPQQFSVDPLTCLIPFNATQGEYESIFPEGINKQGYFQPKGNNPLTSALDKGKAAFKTSGAPYQGKVMNILLNIDYLIGILGEYTSSDPEHAVNLQPFLERIMVDINKSLGNMNLFSVVYRDESNTIQIQDNQWVPTLLGKEKSGILLDNYLSNAKNNPILSGQLPISKVPNLDNLGIARQFEFKTVMSTKLASMIAISAQAATSSVNAKDHSSLSWLNSNYQDRYKRYIQDPSNNGAGSNNNSKSKVNAKANDQKAADLFNAHVASIYGNFLLSTDKIDLAKNYYIERISKVKSGDKTTIAAPFIPADLEVTLDGISGIIMGNSFTIPENRLPSSLKGANGFATVGFIVTGLTHTIESNQWLTRIKGQMIKLREGSGLGLVTGADQVAIPTVTASSTGGPGCWNKYPGACPPEKTGDGEGYSCAEQVLAPAFVGTSNFKTYYPNYTFKKGTSDIKITNPLTEAEIIDDTVKNRFKIGTIPSPVEYFVIHHTGGSSTRAEDTYTTFYCRGLPAQYVIDRAGKIHRFMPDGALAWHAGSGYNGRSIGVEVQAPDDSKVLKVQVEAAARLAHYLGFRKSQVIGHGEISRGKQATEGETIVKYIRSL